jgi:hypothetical protein
MSELNPLGVDRRTAIKWVLAASAAMPLLKGLAWHPSVAGATDAKGYGSDPDLRKIYAPGELWPLTLSAEQRRTATVLCDAIIPADEHSPSASSVGVVDFIDEWISAPYPDQREDRKLILAGLLWLDGEASRRFSIAFTALDASQQGVICDDICYLPKARPELVETATFFARYRDLTAGGFYTSPAGSKDIGYVGNVPLARFAGPPREVLKAVGLA